MLRAALVGASLLILSAMTACGGGSDNLRDAIDGDLQALQLQEADVGEPYRRVSSEIDNNRWSAAFASEPNDCVEAELQVLTGDAADLVERIRMVHEGASIDEHGVEITTAPGLTGDAFVIHRVNRTDVACWLGTSPPIEYTVVFHRANVSGIVSTYTASDEGPEAAVALADRLAERIEDTLAE